MSHAKPSYPWLVADIGGTNARFGLVRTEGGPVEDIRGVRAADFPDPPPAASACNRIEPPSRWRPRSTPTRSSSPTAAG
jgi:glucokinase